MQCQEKYGPGIWRTLAAYFELCSTVRFHIELGNDSPQTAGSDIWLIDYRYQLSADSMTVLRMCKLTGVGGL